MRDTSQYDISAFYCSGDADADPDGADKAKKIITEIEI